ncbi:MAG: acyltransferase [Bacteroidales bacterium]|nr:acyltransferase [Bacteroidales bacterium]
MKTRIYFLDNLRTFLIFLVVLLHAGLVYESVLENVWIVCDPVKNSSIGLVRMYLDIFIMFSIFFISGYFISNSVTGKTDRQFLISKFRRIMLPWIVAVFTLIPAYKVIFLYSRGLPQEEWYTYFHLFQRSGADLGFFANNPTQNWLWFLPVLFLFQIAYWLLSKTKVLSIRISLRSGVIVTFAIGLIYSIIISGLEIRGWYHSPLLHFQRERLLIYFMSFLLGSLCYKLKVFDSNQIIKRLYIWASVTLTIALSVFTVVALNLFFNIIEPGRNYFFISMFIDRLFYYSSMLFSMFSFLYIFIYVFRFKLNRSNLLMNELNKNSYAVYINHMIVMGVFALLLINVSMPATIKFLILTVLTFVITNILVYAYRKSFQKTLSKLIVMKLTILVAILLSVTVYASQIDQVSEDVQTIIPQSEVILPTTDLHMAVINDDLEAVMQHILAGA